MANQHTVATSAVNIVTTVETVVATLGPFNENQVAPAQGIAFDGNINLTTGAGTTNVIMRVRQGTTTAGALVGVAQNIAAAAVANVAVPVSELDPTLVQVGAQYVLTLQQVGAGANGTANRVIFSCQDSTAFE